MKKKLTPKEGFWYNHVKSFLTSGMQQVDYCKKHDLNPKSFSVRKSEYFKRHKEEQFESSNQFIPLSPTSSHLSVKLPSGIELTFDKVPDPIWMGKVLHSFGAIDA